MSDKVLETIDWEHLELAFKGLDIQDKVSRMKIVHQYLPTQVLFARRQEHDYVSNCWLRCQSHPETFQHVFQCNQFQSLEASLNALNKLLSNLRKIRTHPIILRALEVLVKSFLYKKILPFPRTQLGDTSKIKIVSQVFHQSEALIRFFLISELGISPRFLPKWSGNETKPQYELEF